MRRVWRWLRAQDPDGFYLRRAARAAVIVPLTFAIGSQLIGDPQVATFAAFGSFALLLFARFPGDRRARLGAYLTLAVVDAVLICIGTLAATPDWLAVTAMAVIAFGVIFAGVISSVVNGGTQAALLAFILAVMLPGMRSDLPPRLLGWLIACAIAIPVALFVWPPADQDVLRKRTAALCRALAGMLSLQQPPGGGDSLVAVRTAVRELRTAFRTSGARTAAVSTGARAGIRLVDEVEWLGAAVVNACADAPEGWPAQGRALRDVAARVMRACAATLEHDGSAPTAASRTELAESIRALDGARLAVAGEALQSLRDSARAAPASGAAAGEFERPLYAAHELGYAVDLVARTVEVIAVADSRSWWARLAGRRAGIEAPSAASAASRVASGHLDRHSVWLQNGVRGAAGLALAVLLSRLVDAQNAFWVGLGALSVLRSTALSTGSTVLRALAGTVVGFAIGGALVAGIGTSPAVLWPLLPVVILVAASGPATASFVAGQAAFTVFTIILFNIIAPAGWRIGVLRVEDVALGCTASLLAGLLFWPRGAAAALGGALAEAYRASAAYLRASVGAVAGLSGPASDAEAKAAGYRLDEALRQYLAERGSKRVPLEDVAALATGAARLRLASSAIAGLDGHGGGVDGLRGPAALLERRTGQVADWYRDLADSFVAAGGTSAPGATEPAAGRDMESFLDVVLPAIGGCGDAGRAAGAERLLWSGQYVGDVDRLRSHLVGPARKVRAARGRPWWMR